MEDQTGKRFGRLTVLHFVKKEGNTYFWLCRCTCGTEKAVRMSALRSGDTASCGCLAQEIRRARKGAKPKKWRDLKDKRFGRLVAQTHIGGGRWSCLCDCGTAKDVGQHELLYGCTRSCGCLRREVSSATGKLSLKHGHTVGKHATVEYRAWKAMISRCADPANASYANYGGRGIEVCARWRGPDGFAHFIADMGPRPGASSIKGGYSIDRVDNSGNYRPDNCRWATHRQQQRNRRSNHLVDYHGRKITLRELSEITGVSHVTLRWRLAQGWPIEQVVLPVMRRHSS